MALGEQQEGAALIAVRLHQCPRLRFDGITEVAALAVELLALPRQLQGFVFIGCGEQIHHQLRVPEAPDGVDARCDLKAHRPGIHRRIVQAGHLLQRLQAGQAAALERRQAIDDDKGVTLVSLATTSKDLRGKKIRPNVAGAIAFGEAFGAKAKAAGLTTVVFDRAGRRYHGTVKSFAEAARKGGLTF